MGLHQRANFITLTRGAITAVFTACSIGLFLTPLAHAKWDLSLKPLARSYPAGGVLTAQAGFSKLLWGEQPFTKDLPKIGPPRKGRRRWRYGYVRPAFTVQTSGIMNITGADLEFYPISLLGLSVGQAIHQRPQLSSQFDCKTVSCDSLLHRTSLRAQLGAAYGKWFSTVGFKKEWIRTNVVDRPFSEEATGVLGSPGADQLISYNWVVGRTLKRDLSVGYNLMHAHFVHKANRSVTQIVFANKIFSEFAVILGAGTFHSDRMPLGFTMVSMLQFNVFRPIGLF